MRKATEMVHLRLGPEEMSALRALAARRGEPIAKVVRRILTRGLAGEAAADGVSAVEMAVRRVVREELKSQHDLIFRGAFQAALSAALITLIDSRAQKLEPEARKRAAAALRRRPDDDPAPLGDGDGDRR